MKGKKYLIITAVSLTLLTGGYFVNNAYFKEDTKVTILDYEAAKGETKDVNLKEYLHEDMKLEDHQQIIFVDWIDKENFLYIINSFENKQHMFYIKNINTNEDRLINKKVLEGAVVGGSLPPILSPNKSHLMYYVDTKHGKYQRIVNISSGELIDLATETDRVYLSPTWISNDTFLCLRDNYANPSSPKEEWVIQDLHKDIIAKGSMPEKKTRNSTEHIIGSIMGSNLKKKGEDIEGKIYIGEYIFNDNETAIYDEYHELEEKRSQVHESFFKTKSESEQEEINEEYKKINEKMDKLYENLPINKPIKQSIYAHDTETNKKEKIYEITGEKALKLDVDIHDGKIYEFYEGTNRTSMMRLYDKDKKNPKEYLLSTSGQMSIKRYFSPDGRYLAYSTYVASENALKTGATLDEFNVNVIDIQTGVVKRVLELGRSAGFVHTNIYWNEDSTALGFDFNGSTYVAELNPESESSAR